MAIVSVNLLALGNGIVTTTTQVFATIDLHTGAFEEGVETDVGFLSKTILADGVVAVAGYASSED